MIGLAACVDYVLAGRCAHEAHRGGFTWRIAPGADPVAVHRRSGTEVGVCSSELVDLVAQRLARFQHWTREQVEDALGEIKSALFSASSTPEGVTDARLNWAKLRDASGVVTSLGPVRGRRS
ncbi:MAG: hypothetical protein JKY65_18315 [Planctomycetes bacterium]|nr:hypothetical protein [Planctomycetota bacterium]